MFLGCAGYIFVTRKSEGMAVLECRTTRKSGGSDSWWLRVTKM